MRFHCNFCSSSFAFFEKLLNHYHLEHSPESNFSLQCNILGCTSSFTSIRSYKRHIRRLHKEFHTKNMFTRENAAVEENFNPEAAEIPNPLPETEHNNNNADMEEEHNEMRQTDYNSIVGDFLLELREHHKTTGAACDFVSQKIKVLMEKERYSYQQQIRTNLNENNININNELESLLSSSGACSDALEGFSSSYQLNTYVKDKDFYVEPVEIQLGYNPQLSRFETFQYIPILKTLQALLKHDDVLAEVFHGNRSTDGIFRDYVDGKNCNNNNLFSSLLTSLKIQLYGDDFGCANPLGNKQKKCKIFAIYFSLLNINVAFRSKLDNIQLVILCPSLLAKKYGYPQVLSPLLGDIRKLETSGISIVFEDNLLHFWGSVSLFSADNLSAHGIGGFYENFSTVDKICRFCMCSRKNLDDTDITNFMTRTPKGYLNQVSAIEANPQLSKLYGVKENSCLNGLKFFHVIDGLPPDVGHDFFEGVVPEVLRVVVVSLIQDGLFSLEDLNLAINNFKYASCDKANKPQTIHAKTLANLKFKYTACEQWNFIRLFPLMIGNKIEEDNLKWHVVLLLLEVVNDVCSRSFSEVDILILHDKIVSFLDLYKEVFPCESFKPKFHYLLHYSEQIRLTGPPIAKWCMRFEAKHQYFKEIRARTKNTINLCKTLALRHQAKMYLYLRNDEILLHNRPHVYHSTTNDIILIEDYVQKLIHSAYPEYEGKVLRGSGVVFEGHRYDNGSVVILDMVDDELEFGLIDQVVKIGGKIYLVCGNLCSLYFDSHFHAFVVEELQTYVMKEIAELFDYHPLGLYKANDKKYVPVRYTVRRPLLM